MHVQQYVQQGACPGYDLDNVNPNVPVEQL